MTSGSSHKYKCCKVFCYFALGDTIVGLGPPWRVGWSGPGRAAGVALAVGTGRGRRPDRAGPGGRGLDPAVGQVVPLALGRRFYPSRGIGPIGVGWPRRGRG